MKVAVLHDYFFTMGGAERVAIEIAKIFDAPVYTSYYDLDTIKTSVTVYEISSIKFLLKFKMVHFYYVPNLFENFNTADYDVLISSGNWSKFIVPKPEQVHIHYCHTPPRAIYDSFHEVSARLGIISRFFFKRWASRMRIRDYIASQRIDFIIANSVNVQKRVSKYWRRNVNEIIYPPVNVKYYENAKPYEEEEYFLTVSRLYPEKRVDLLVEAFKYLPNKKLVVVGSGPELKNLKKIAPSNVVFLGWVDEKTKASLYRSAEALLFVAKDEDFGIVPVEAQAAGTPIIGIAEGGLLESVIPGKTGILIPYTTREEFIRTLVETIRGFKKDVFDPVEIIRNAQRFDLSIFKKKFKEYLHRIVKEY